MIKKLLMIAAVAVFMFDSPDVQADIVLFDNMTSASTGQQFEIGLTFTEQDSVNTNPGRVRITNLASTSNMVSMTIGGNQLNLASSWGFDYLDPTSGNAVVTQPNTGEADGIGFNTGSISFTSGLGVGQFAEFDFDVDFWNGTAGANQQRSFGTDLGNGLFSFAYANGDVGNFTSESLGPFATSSTLGDAPGAVIGGAITAVPEPTSFVMFGTTIVGLCLRRRRQV